MTGKEVLAVVQFVASSDTVLRIPAAIAHLHKYYLNLTHLNLFRYFSTFLKTIYLNKQENIELAIIVLHGNCFVER